MEKNENGNIFQTSDISLTAFFLTQGISLIDIQENYPRHFTFVLSDFGKCTELKQQYLNNASAPARELFAQREMLISEIKSRER